jgi:hypothetical protein
MHCHEIPPAAVLARDGFARSTASAMDRPAADVGQELPRCPAVAADQSRSSGVHGAQDRSSSPTVRARPINHRAGGGDQPRDARLVNQRIVGTLPPMSEALTAPNIVSRQVHRSALFIAIHLCRAWLYPRAVPSASRLYRCSVSAEPPSGVVRVLQSQRVAHPMAIISVTASRMVVPKSRLCPRLASTTPPTAPIVAWNSTMLQRGAVDSVSNIE